MGCFTKNDPPVKVCPVCGFDESEADESVHKLPLRTILHGKYLLGNLLGEGGFGITYLGWDLNLDLKVAVKEYYPTGYVYRETTTTVHPFTGSQGEHFLKGREKFIKEAKSLAKFFNLPGIVLVKDYFEENGTAYIVMEFIDGLTLKSYLAKSGENFPSTQLFDLMKPVMSSLAEVHKTGLIHRDISPDNIMINTEGRLKLLDFGAARDYTDSGNKSQSVLIKPGYAPEEQYRAKGKQGPWTDVYALCATMYKCITGVTPDEAIERVRGDEVEPPSKLGVAIAPNQEEALMKGLSVYSEDRYQTVQELYDSLYTVIAEIVSAPASATAPSLISDAKLDTKPEPKPKQKPVREPKSKPIREPKPEREPKPKPIREPKPEREPKSHIKAGDKPKPFVKPGIVAIVGICLIAVAVLLLILSPWQQGEEPVPSPIPSDDINGPATSSPEPSPAPDSPPSISDLYATTINLGQMNSPYSSEGWGGWFAGTIQDKNGEDKTSVFSADDFKKSRYLIVDLTNHIENTTYRIVSLDLTWRGDNFFHSYWDDRSVFVTEGIKIEDGIAIIEMPRINGYRLYLQCDNLLIQLRLNYNDGSYTEDVKVTDSFFANSSNPNITFEPDIPPFNVNIDDYFERTHTLGEFDWVDDVHSNGLWSTNGRRLSDFQSSQFLVLEFSHELSEATQIRWSTDWVGNSYTHTDLIMLNTDERAVYKHNNTFFINLRAMRNYENYASAKDLIDILIHPNPRTLLIDAYFADRINPRFHSVDDFGRTVTLGGFNDISEWGKGWHVRSRNEINRIKESRFFIVEFDGEPPFQFGRFHWNGDYENNWRDGVYISFGADCFIMHENFCIINLSKMPGYSDFLRVRNHLFLQFDPDVPDVVDSYFANYIGRR
jgi:serine/threonine protein kinase